jgi:hypothetical protein
MDSPVLRKTVPRQSLLPKAGERSTECSQPTPGLADRVQESKPPNKEVVDRAASDTISSHDNSYDVPLDTPLVPVAPSLLKPKPVSLSRAQPAQPIHPLDVPDKADAFGTHRPQLGLETAVRQSPEPQLLDMVAPLEPSTSVYQAPCLMNGFCGSRPVRKK